MHLRFASFAGILLTSAAPVWAADKDGIVLAATAEAAEDAPPEVIVTGQRTEYGVRSTVTGTKTNTDVKNIPQAMTVISESQIEDQDLRSIADVLTFVPGATPGTGEANRDQITLRGNNTTADFFVNGIRDDVQYFRDLYNVDRVEVLRGPNAMIFGRGGGGGIVNRVTKRSSLSAPYREFAVSGDSEGGYRLTGDIDQPLGASVGLRVNGVYENGESFRRHVDLERYGVNPTVGISAGPNTRIDVGYEYFHDRRTTDRGVPSRNGRPIEGFDEVFFGDPELSYAEADVHVGTLAIHHDFGNGLSLRNRTLLGNYDKFYQNVFPSGIVAPRVGETGDQVALGAYNSRNDRKNLFNQTDLIWEGRLGGIDQTLLLGFEAGRQRSRNLRLTGTFAGGDNRFPLTDPTIDADLTWGPSATDGNNRTQATVASVYVQDQIRLSPMLEIVAGLRFDRFKLSFNDLRPGRIDFGRQDETWSPRLGLIFKPQPSLSVYTSFSRSFLPQSGDQFGSLDVNTDALKPERFDNYEIGAKWEPIRGLLATFALYRLDRTNTRALDPATNLTVLTGAQRSKGLEVGLERNISDKWQVSGGYAWQKAKIRSRTTACDPALDTCEVPLVPRHQFSMWNRYNLNERLGFGLGIIARSKSFAGISNDVVLPSYVRADAAVFFELTDGIEAQVNVENLFGAAYFPTAHSDNNIAPGAPTTARATLRFRF